jgi:hypothetical protein
MLLVSSINSKTKFARERQRFRIVNVSIYGIWSDSFNTIELKISPTGAHTRIKIMNVNDPVVLERISFFCGLEFVPKRTKWRGFDFITHLARVNDYAYNYGLVHMPNANRKNLAKLTVLDNFNISLDFFFVEIKNNDEVQNYVGSLALTKRIR